MPMPTPTPGDLASAFPLPLPAYDVAFYEAIASWARDAMSVVNANNLLWIIVGIGLAAFVLGWVVHTVQNPPRF